MRAWHNPLPADAGNRESYRPPLPRRQGAQVLRLQFLLADREEALTVARSHRDEAREMLFCVMPQLLLRPPIQ
jgi:hypothetical protein